MLLKALTAALLSAVLLACGTPAPIGGETGAPDPVPDVPKDTTFADRLMLATAADGNRMLSPYSAKMCLAMLANGAAGETRAQLLSALGIDDLDAYNAAAEETLARYAGYADVLALHTANSLWLNQSRYDGKMTFKPAYAEAMQKAFEAEVREVTDKNSVEEVNKWVKEKTNQKIPTVLTEANRKFAAALVNAVYFKAAWEDAFEAAFTEEGDFHNADGTVSKTDFMHKTDKFSYYAEDGLTALQLPYSRISENGEKWIDGSFSMYVLLTDRFDVENMLQTVRENAARKKVRVTLPKFEMDYSVTLDDILKAAGVTDAYDPGKADFSPMLADPVVLDTVLQKTYVKVDENGTEAAAVTAVMMAESAYMPEPEIIYDFTADRPFCFAVCDDRTDEILFVGYYGTVEN